MMLVKINNILYEIIDIESDEPIPDDDYVVINILNAISYVVNNKCTFELKTYEKDIIDLYKNALAKANRFVEIMRCTDRNIVDLDK